MKRLFFLTAILAVFGLSSCEKEPSQAIIGTWEAEKMVMTAEGMSMDMNMDEMGIKLELTFHEDGTANAYMESEGMRENSPFEYEVSGNTLYMIAEGESITVPITIDGKKMTMEMREDGAKIVIHLKKK